MKIFENEYIESWLERSKAKAEAGDADSGEANQVMEPLEANDVLVYYAIILPATFILSSDILAGRLQEEQHASAIDAIFNSGTYPIKDPAAYLFARSIFEEILILHAPVSKITEMFSKYAGVNTAILQPIANLLLSTIADVKTAAIQQMEVLPWLERNLSRLPSVYRYALVPYVVVFWECQAKRHPGDFFELNFMRTRGWKDIQNAAWNNKIGKLLQVITYHLEISPSDDIQAMIDGKFV